MAWSVDDIYKLTLFLTRKNQSASISARDLAYAWNTEQNAYHSDLLGKWQSRNNSKTGVNTGLVLNETMSTKLSGFTIPVSLPIVSGNATKPSDFIYELAVRKLGGIVTKINHGQIQYVNDDIIDPPTIDGSYYIVEYGGYYKIFPANATGNLELDYIASCSDIFWAYTLDTNNRQVYDPINSVQPKWDTPTIISITKRALTSFGVSFKDNDFANFGAKNTATGDS